MQRLETRFAPQRQAPAPAEAAGAADAPLVPPGRYRWWDDSLIHMNWSQACPALADSTGHDDYSRVRAAGPPVVFEALERVSQQTREAAGRLFGADSRQVFFGANATGVLQTMVDVFLQRHGRRHTRILATRDAYASVALAGGRMAPRRWCEPTTAGFAEAVAAARHPTLVVLEGQHYPSGSRYGLEEIAEVAERRRQAGMPVEVVVDVSQWPHPSTRAERYSLLFTGSKWAGGPNGVAVGILRPGMPDTPSLDGWGALQGGWTLPLPPQPEFKRGAARLDAAGGGKPWLALFLLREGLRLVETLGRDAIERHVMTLAGQLRAGLRARGVQTLPVERPSGNVALPFADPDRARQFLLALRRAGVVASDGVARVRLSPGPWNRSSDAAAVVDAVADLTKKERSAFSAL